MRSKYAELLSQFKNAFVRFEEVMRENKADIVQDSAIQRFELTFELAWKTLKRLILKKDLAKESFTLLRKYFGVLFNRR